MAYIKPCKVVSPKAHWKLIEVLADKGPGEVAYALGKWDDTLQIGMRWNGTDDRPLGSPVAHAQPVWTMTDPPSHRGIIKTLPDEEAQRLACKHLDIDWRSL